MLFFQDTFKDAVLYPRPIIFHGLCNAGSPLVINNIICYDNEHKEILDLRFKMLTHRSYSTGWHGQAVLVHVFFCASTACSMWFTWTNEFVASCDLLNDLVEIGRAHV